METPKAFGLMLSAVKSRRRALASAMAQLPINLLGMAGGPLERTVKQPNSWGFSHGKWGFNMI
jgi:hypothetical protein